jgi:uncharacterized protein (DUF2062 family)|uniref:DUF2062 domain-containing protein n=1 Tax=Desulfobacca acetoxidans TaxID=60893 RepID=A0A7V6A0Z8_9BACT
MNLKRLIRYHWLKFRRLQGEPRRIALGAALGVFIGITPTIPFHTAMALGLAPLLRVSVMAAYMGIWISNPLTWVPQYLAAYEVGKYLLFPGQGPLCLPDRGDLSTFMCVLWRGGLALQVGGIIIALPPAIITYFVTLWAVNRYRQRRARLVPRVCLLSKDRPAASGPEA